MTVLYLRGIILAKGVNFLPIFRAFQSYMQKIAQVNIGYPNWLMLSDWIYEITNQVAVGRRVLRSLPWPRAWSKAQKTGSRSKALLKANESESAHSTEQNQPWTNKAPELPCFQSWGFKLQRERKGSLEAYITLCLLSMCQPSHNPLCYNEKSDVQFMCRSS